MLKRDFVCETFACILGVTVCYSPPKRLRSRDPLLFRTPGASPSSLTRAAGLCVPRQLAKSTDNATTDNGWLLGKRLSSHPRVGTMIKRTEEDLWKRDHPVAPEEGDTYTFPVITHGFSNEAGQSTGRRAHLTDRRPVLYQNGIAMRDVSMRFESRHPRII
jgi:hypothetical protein